MRMGLFEIHIAVLFFGLAGLFGKLVNQPPVVIVFGRVLFAMAFLLPAMWYLKHSLRLKRTRDYCALLLQGLILAVHWGTFFQAIQVSTVAVGLITFSTFPIFVTFLEPVFFKEQLRPADVVLALVTFAGVLLVVPAFNLDNTTTQGALWGIASGLTFAVLSIMNRKYARTYSSLVVAFYQDAAAALFLLPFLFLPAPALTLPDMLWLALLGIVFTGVAHSLFIKGLAHVKAQTASIIASLEPVYGILAAALLLGELPVARELFGGAVILGAALYATIRKQKEGPDVANG
ncbi:MAG: EamA family transporter [Desulfobacterales bacterium]|nr:EamA family transporter [Desulfobacterales bacterium]